MKLCIFGADGRTGVEVVRYAVSQGFSCVACVYRKPDEGYFDEGVVVRQVDILDSESGREALVGCDAVVSVVGHIRGSHPRMQTEGMKNIVSGMEAHHIQRILRLTGTGARAPGDIPSFVDRLLNFLVMRVDPERMRDGIAHLDVLKNSRLDWTVVRVLKLGSSRREVSEYRLTPGGPAQLLTSRKKVAKVLVDLIHDTKSVRKLPVVSG